MRVNKRDKSKYRKEKKKRSSKSFYDICKQLLQSVELGEEMSTAWGQAFSSELSITKYNNNKTNFN